MDRISRREMLLRLGMGLGAAALVPLAAPVRTRAQAALARSFVSLPPLEAETLRSIVARLIPSDEHGPGALEARADRYIDRGLAGALKAWRPDYTSGLVAVNGQAQLLNQVSFSKLSPADQDDVLTTIEQTSPAFLNLVRTHTVQGTFSDPFYGGNSNFIGWEMIGYPGARIVVSPSQQVMDRKPEPSLKSAYDYAMFFKGEI